MQIIEDLMLEALDVTTRLFLETEKKTIFDDDPEGSVFDYAGSNVDDAYELGVKDGGILMARVLLAELTKLGDKLE